MIQNPKTATSVLDQDTTIRTSPEGTQAMIDAPLIHEALARSRQREAEHRAREYRRVRRLTAGRFWTRLAVWAARRADRARVTAC